MRLGSEWLPWCPAGCDRYYGFAYPVTSARKRPRSTLPGSTATPRRVERPGSQSRVKRASAGSPDSDVTQTSTERAASSPTLRTATVTYPWDARCSRASITASKEGGSDGWRASHSRNPTRPRNNTPLIHVTTSSSASGLFAFFFLLVAIITRATPPPLHRVP